MLCYYSLLDLNKACLAVVTSVWILWRTTRLLMHANCLLQISHSYGFSFLWILLWTTRFLLTENCLSHKSHRNGFSLVWDLCCWTWLWTSLTKYSIISTVANMKQYTLAWYLLLFIVDSLVIYKVTSFCNCFSHTSSSSLRSLYLYPHWTELVSAFWDTCCICFDGANFYCIYNKYDEISERFLDQPAGICGRPARKSLRAGVWQKLTAWGQLEIISF